MELEILGIKSFILNYLTQFSLLNKSYFSRIKQVSHGHIDLFWYTKYIVILNRNITN